MTISTRHPQHIEFSPIWAESVTAIAGQVAIKKAGTKYLSCTSGMKARWNEGGSDAYDAYKARARFSDIPNESLEGMLGVLFGKDPQGSLDEIVTNDGKSVYELGREVADVVYVKGRHLLVIDLDEDKNAYIAQYSTESMINWKLDDKSNLIFAVFEEEVEEDPDNKYSHTKVKQYREFTLDAINVYDKDEKLVSNTVRTTEKIRIVSITPSDLGFDCKRPPISRIVECCLAAYRNSADYQQAMFITAQPTPYSSGCTEDQFKKNSAAGIGAGAHWYLGENREAKAGYLEFSGKGVAALKESQDAELNSAAEQAVKLVHVGGVESGVAKQIRDTSQKSALSMLADSVSLGVNLALRYLTEVSVKPRTFEPYAIQMQDTTVAEAVMISAIGSRVNAGGYPKIVEYNYALKSGLFIGTYEEWEESIAENGGDPDDMDDTDDALNPDNLGNGDE